MYSIPMIGKSNSEESNKNELINCVTYFLVIYYNVNKLLLVVNIVFPQHLSSCTLLSQMIYF